MYIYLSDISIYLSINRDFFDSTHSLARVVHVAEGAEDLLEISETKTYVSIPIHTHTYRQTRK